MSSINNIPCVDVFDVFDDDDYVGGPSVARATPPKNGRDKTRTSQNKSQLESAATSTAVNSTDLATQKHQVVKSAIISRIATRRQLNGKQTDATDRNQIAIDLSSTSNTQQSSTSSTMQINPQESDRTGCHTKWTPFTRVCPTPPAMLQPPITQTQRGRPKKGPVYQWIATNPAPQPRPQQFVQPSPPNLPPAQQFNNNLGNQPFPSLLPLPPFIHTGGNNYIPISSTQPYDPSMTAAVINEAIKTLNNTNINPSNVASFLTHFDPSLRMPDMINLNPGIASSSAASHPKPGGPPNNAKKYVIKPTEDQLLQEDEQVDAEPEDEFREVEMYADYVPSKLKIGRPHPDPVVESSSLSTVKPPDIFYKTSFPAKLIDKGLLSSLQLEAVIYACQRHASNPDNTFNCQNPRPGFLIGDGAGVGKGRTIAGIIYENFLKGRKQAIWISVSSDLKIDAERDLKDIGANIPVHLLGKFTYGKKISVESGVMFSTYSGLVSKSQSMKGALSTRLGQLLNWVGPDFDGVLVFDECHKAKNINPTKVSSQSKTATAVLELQEKIPKARVVYASATGATETRNLGYMTRLGMWGEHTPYHTFVLFRGSIERRGVGAMELVAVDLKLRGSYIARQLSFKNTSFSIEVASLTDKQKSVYDECTSLWAETFRNFQFVADRFYYDKKIKKTLWPSYWAAHQKFFHYLCIGIKVPIVIKLAKKALADGKCVVIGLQSTGESKTNEALEEGGAITDFISTAKAVFESLIENHFPVPERQKSRSGFLTSSSSPQSESTDSIFLENILDTAKDFDSAYHTRMQRKRILEDLVEDKKRQQSTRSLRAKKRSCSKPSTSRLKILDDSDTELSNQLTTSSDSSSSYQDTSSSSTSTITEELPNIKRIIESESETECLITGTVEPKNFEVITLSSGDEDTLDFSGQKASNQPSDPMIQHGDTLSRMRREMLEKLKLLAGDLPNNTLDELINRLGGPDKVAEMTGRKGRIVQDEDGHISYKNRFGADPADEMNILEKERFMKGEKLIAIISEAASSGISLQADRRVKNQRRRVHITIELPWSADRAIQQFGRTHRSNQVSAPEYIFIISDLAGERRFASIVAKRLESLGALTHGDRRSSTTTNDLHQFNIMGRYSHDALISTLRIIEDDAVNQIPPDLGDAKKFLRNARQALIDTGLAKGSPDAISIEATPTSLNIPTFLNRLLGMKVDVQNLLFRLFTETMNKIIRRKKFAGQYDSGIIELNSDSGLAHSCEPTHYNLKSRSGTVSCSLWNIKMERGISWNQAETLYKKSQADLDKRSGFYKKFNPITRINMIYLYVRDRREGALPDLFRLYKPNMGLDPKPVFYETFRYSTKAENMRDIKSYWDRIYTQSERQCIHMCLYNTCSRVVAGMRCDVGLRYKTYTVMSGGVLTAWPYLERTVPQSTQRLQIVRVKLSEHDRVIGKLINI